LYLLEGDKLNAKKYLALAATQTNMLAEKIFIERLMRRIDED
jgi:hypothetical protein